VAVAVGVNESDSRTRIPISTNIPYSVNRPRKRVFTLLMTVAVTAAIRAIVTLVSVVAWRPKRGMIETGRTR
jgi:hypothetical protein